LRSLRAHRYEPLESIKGVPQTRFTYTTEVDLGGVFKPWILSKIAVGQLMLASTMLVRFARARQMEEDFCDELSSSLEAHSNGFEMGTVMYSADEKKLFAAGQIMFSLFRGKKRNRLKMGSPLTVAKLAAVKDEGKNDVYGYSTAKVRAHHYDVLAYWWHYNRLKSE
jgi:hypothetical protein